MHDHGMWRQTVGNEPANKSRFRTMGMYNIRLNSSQAVANLSPGSSVFQTGVLGHIDNMNIASQIIVESEVIIEIWICQHHGKNQADLHALLPQRTGHQTKVLT